MITEMQLLICDIDLTLIRNDRTMSNITRQVLNNIHQNGVAFGIASGRPIDELDAYHQDWGLDFPFDYLIGMNGCELKNCFNNQIYNYYPLESKWIKEILEVMANFDANPFIYTKDHRIICGEIDEMMLKSAKSSNKHLTVAKSVADFYQDDNAKIMFRMKESLVDEVVQYFNAHPSTHYGCFKTQPTLLEFADPNVSKGYALRQLCTLENIDISKVVAFGDTSNDNTMLAYSGLGVCMLNGSADTLKIADDITAYSNDEDGLAIYLEDHFPNLTKRNY